MADLGGVTFSCWIICASLIPHYCSLKFHDHRSFRTIDALSLVALERSQHHSSDLDPQMSNPTVVPRKNTSSLKPPYYVWSC
ncbi:hypothetical protein BDR05DRAFT_970000 [Suillus weaverae]|nr:hypothetical protein BDR05DRAFT_970000 [Suillus weaverae]